MANALPTEANIKLAALLRECAGHIEQNEFHPSVYKALGGLHEYAAAFQSSSNSSTPTSKQMDEAVNSQAAPPADVKVVKPQVHEVAVTKPYVTPGGIGSGLGALGSKFKKGLGLSSSSTPGVIDSANRQATSTKNADRIKADLAATSVHSSTPVVTTHHEEWCETHFVMGCACKFRQPGSVNWPTSNVVAPPATTAMTRPAFSRPSNPNTNLIANGWIEQQRRSKMRIVWKDILASLVEGRKPGEETTLWIQREISNPTTGKIELEALHQIPVKWLEDVKFLDFYGDHRFSIKVYNVADEFLFKCVNEDAAQNWVLTLLSIKEIVNNKVNNKMVDDRPASDFSFGSTATTPVAAATTTTTAAAPAAMADTDSPPYKMSIKELRALANGAGINTTGMERSDLEKAVSEISNGNGERQQQDAEQRKRQMDEDEIMRRQLEEQQRQRVAAAVTSNVRKAAEEADAKRLAERQAAERQKAEEEQRRVWQQQVEQRKRQEDAVRAEAVRQEAARQEAARQEAARQQVARDEAARQQAAREEAARQQAAREEAARQQAARDEAARQQAAREEAAQREAYAKQQWAQQQAAQQAYAAQQQQWAQQQAAAQAQARAAQQQAWQAQQQQQQQQQYRAQQPDKFPPAGVTPPQPAPPPPKPPNSGSSASSVNQKYANMANGGDIDGQATIAHVKRNILIHWALQPPMLQSLRPIHLLLSSVHTVFPPAFGVPGHAYFGKWKAVTAADLGGANPDEEKLKKAVRQLRFFLHPDKLPKDLSEEQTFMCKMLWDVANDSWEEHHKKKEDLDWIKH